MAPDSNLGNLIARLVKLLANKVENRFDTEALSTEELKHHLEKVNYNIKSRISKRQSILSSRNRGINTVLQIQDMKTILCYQGM